MTIRRFYISPQFLSKYNDITGPDVVYITRVLRLKKNNHIEIFDGCGNQYLAKITNLSAKIVKTKIIKRFNEQRESHFSITIAQALLKSKKMDIIIRQLTELGINKWIPFISERSIPIFNNTKISSRLKRWESISIEAVKQSHRTIIPQIFFLSNFNTLLNFSESYDMSLIFWENQVVILEKIENLDKKINNIIIIIGPEGGFEKKEIINAKEKGVVVSSLGPRILRAETASIAACSIAQYIFGDINKKT